MILGQRERAGNLGYLVGFASSTGGAYVFRDDFIKYPWMLMTHRYRARTMMLATAFIISGTFATHKLFRFPFDTFIQDHKEEDLFFPDPNTSNTLWKELGEYTRKKANE